MWKQFSEQLSMHIYTHIYKYIFYIIYKYTLYTYIYHTFYFIPLVSKYTCIYVYAYMECVHMCVARKSCVIVWKNNCPSVYMYIKMYVCVHV